jgi:hypothetical protein
MSDLKTDETAAVGWVKTHTMLAAVLGAFVLGVVCGLVIHAL